MGPIVRRLALSYVGLAETHLPRSLPAVHERGATDPYGSAASAIPSFRGPVRGAPVRRPPESSCPRVGLRLKPGQRGTRQLLALHGDRLVCVRYRYDSPRKTRLKTVEIIVSERDWEPPPPRFPPEHIVGVRVSLAETTIRDRVKRAGATWNPERKAWELRYDRAMRLGLTRRIVDDQASNTGCLEGRGRHLPVDARGASR